MSVETLESQRAELRKILQENRIIAVVGLSDRPERTSNSVSAYLQRHGYTIIPVNPNIPEALGEKAYPDLLALPLKPDLVLIFRRSEDTPPVVDQAIQIGAKVVWMQTGISHAEAARKARQAGLSVVMDKCMYVMHKKLLGDVNRQEIQT
jgi:predicted CoA-binding protein